ncbi:transposase [Enterococcus sp. LJL51]|uniref:transposase n=1 Tax=Enterococcus sp. LJL51 TaxID=3416656 RepID=UPI003CEA5098
MKHKQRITNAFHYSSSNCVTNGPNNKSKESKRFAFGYRIFYHLRSRIYSIQNLIFSKKHLKQNQFFLFCSKCYNFIQFLSSQHSMILKYKRSDQDIHLYFSFKVAR